MSKIFEIADGFVETLAELNPIVATYLGVPGYDHLMPDYHRGHRDGRTMLSGMC